VQVQNIVSKKLARFIDHRDLAARAQARVDPEHGDGPRGRRQQKVLQVVAKDLNSIAVRALLQLQTHLALNRGIQQTFPRVVNSQLEMRRPIPSRAKDMHTE